MKKEDALLEEIYALLGKESRKSITDLIDDRIKFLNISQRAFAKIVDHERKSLQRLLSGETSKIDIVTFIKISEFLRVDTLELIQQYVSELPVAVLKSMESSKKATYIVENFDLKALKALGLINDINDFDEIELKINQAFGLESIFEYSEKLNYALFSRPKRGIADKMKDFWVKSAYVQIERINNPNEFNKEELKGLIPHIKPYTMDIQKGFLKVVKALFKTGVTVFHQPCVKNMQVRGATFLFQGKPYIIITGYNDRYDTMWFSLLHELCHVLKDLDSLQSTKYHLSEDQTDVFLQEEQANLFAREYFFGEKEINFIKPYITNQLYVEQYAKSKKIHPSLAYGSFSYYMYEKGDSNYFAQFNKLKLIPSCKDSLGSLSITPWSVETYNLDIERVLHIFQD